MQPTSKECCAFVFGFVPLLSVVLAPAGSCAMLTILYLGARLSLTIGAVVAAVIAILPLFPVMLHGFLYSSEAPATAKEDDNANNKTGEGFT